MFFDELASVPFPHAKYNHLIIHNINAILLQLSDFA